MPGSPPVRGGALIRLFPPAGERNAASASQTLAALIRLGRHQSSSPSPHHEPGRFPEHTLLDYIFPGSRELPAESPESSPPILPRTKDAADSPDPKRWLPGRNRYSALGSHPARRDEAQKPSPRSPIILRKDGPPCCALIPLGPHALQDVPKAFDILGSATPSPLPFRFLAREVSSCKKSG